MNSDVLTERVREKIRETIFDCMSEDELKSLIKAEYDLLFSKRQKFRNGPLELPSIFSEIISNELKALIKGRVESWLADNFRYEWDEVGGKLVGDAVAELVPIVQRQMVQNVVQFALSQF